MKKPKPAGSEASGAKRERGATTIYAALREDILTLRLAPGSAVDEVALAHQFGLSRTPVREALLMLAGESLVRFLPNRSSIISPLTMENMNDYFDTLLILTRSIMIAAANKRRPEDGDRLRELLSDFRTSIGQDNVFQVVFSQLNLLKGFATVARNDFLGKFFPDCLDYGRRTMLLHYFPLVSAADLDVLAESYGDLIEAVEAGDAATCNRLVGDQLNSVVRIVQMSLEPRFAGAVDLSTDTYSRFKDLRNRT